MSYPFKPDPRLDLVLERVLDAPRELLWRAMTTPEHVKQWFTPKPWLITDCEIDLKPGGLFRTRMQSPDGKEVSDRHCCYLDIVPSERLVWTDALLPGYRPSGEALHHRGHCAPAGWPGHTLHRHRHPPRRGDPQQP